MAVSKAPRKKKPANISKAERRLRKLHRDVTEFIKEYNEQSENIRQWDVALRVFAHRLRAILLQPCHPELIEKYLPGFKPEVELTKEEWEDVDLHLFAFVMSKNQLIRKLRNFEKNELEAIRAMYQITGSKNNSDARKNARKQIDNVEIDVVQSILGGSAIIEILSLYADLRSDIIEYFKTSVPTMYKLFNDSEHAHHQYLFSIPQGAENLKVFGADEKELEDLFVERWDVCREEYVAKLNALYGEASEETAEETTKHAVASNDDEIEDAEIVEDEVEVGDEEIAEENKDE